jgi:hypothetical protein
MFWVLIFAALAVFQTLAAYAGIVHHDFWTAAVNVGFVFIDLVMIAWAVARARGPHRRWHGTYDTSLLVNTPRAELEKLVTKNVQLMANRAGVDDADIVWSKPRTFKGRDGKTYWEITAVESRRKGRRAAR